MKIYWTIDSIPELAAIPSQKKQKIYQFFMRNIVFKKWETWLLFSWVGLVTGLLEVGLMFIQKEFHIIPTDNMLILFAIQIISGNTIGITVCLLTIKAVSRPWLREYIKTIRPE